jgi:hypothetical protein
MMNQYSKPTNQYFNLTFPLTERLLADNNKAQGERELIRCSLNPEHYSVDRRISQLYLELRHNNRNEKIIWGAGCAIHEQVLEAFEKQRFTGYRTKPALVRFRDGSISTQYHEFIVTGWAGIASPESGIRLTVTCPACLYKEYSAITNYDKVIDWSQWTGEDFFTVWPVVTYVFCTPRVAEWLLRETVRSVRIEERLAGRARHAGLSRLGFAACRLSNYMPEDLAMKYGRPLGLE